MLVAASIAVDVLPADAFLVDNLLKVNGVLVPISVPVHVQLVQQRAEADVRQHAVTRTRTRTGLSDDRLGGAECQSSCDRWGHPGYGGNDKSRHLPA